jgi:tetratricopeptide (TPR) repeat protein
LRASRLGSLAVALGVAAALVPVSAGSAVAESPAGQHAPGLGEVEPPGVLPDLGVAALQPADAAPPEPGSQAPLPGVTQRSDGTRSAVEAAWFSGGTEPKSRAQSARVRALQLGAHSYEGAARALLAADDRGERLPQTLLAVQLAPDLPLAHLELARAHLDEGQHAEAVMEGVAGLRAIPRNLEATFWLAASLLAMFAAVLTTACLVFIVWVGASVFRHAAHDLGDLVSNQMPDFARGALLGTLLLFPVLLGEELMGVVLGLFLLGFLYCEPGYRRALVLAAVLFVIGVYPMTRFAGMALTALDSDPVATAAHAVVRDMTLPSDLEELAAAGDDDALAQAALALHERRAGNAAAAFARYERLLAEAPQDPVVLANLSNMHFERGEHERSIELGERAAGLIRSATLLFNLSQVYARSFRMDEFEGAMAQAQRVDAAVVADLSRTSAPDFVADLPFPLAAIRERMLESATGDAFVHPVSRALMPGRLGESWMNTAGGFALVALVGLVARRRWEHSSCCRRCGRRVCNRCDGSVWNSQICDGCHHLFHRPETTDPAMRMARLSDLRKREARLARVAIAASVLVPGVAGLLARRPDLSFLGLFFFAWAGFLALWRDGIVADPLALGIAGPLVFAAAAALSVLGYLGVVSTGLAIRRRL